MSSDELPVQTEELRAIIRSQYHAALAMLRDAIERCPEDLWESHDYPNAFWQIAYHSVFFGHLYLFRNVTSFRPWPQHQGKVQHEDGLAGPSDPKSSLPLLPTPYSKAEVLEYWSLCDSMVDSAVNALDLQSPDCGFHWYKNTSKLEHQFISIRHIQHHAAQLADRLRSKADAGTRWIGIRR